MPNLFLSPAEWADLPQKLSDPFFARLHEANERAMAAYDALQGESLLDVPDDLGDARAHRSPATRYRTVKGRLLRSAIALHVGGRESAWEFASRTIDFLLRREFWRVAAHGCRIDHFDLKMGDLLYDAVFTLEAFGERLDEARRGRLIDLMIEEGLGAYLRGWEAGEWWRVAEFNWGTATHGNAGLAALALAGIDPDLCERVLVRAREGVAIVIDALPLDGWWTEGSMYHTTTLGHLSDFMIALHNARGDDLGLLLNPRLVEAFGSRVSALAPDGGLYNFSNCSTRLTEWYLPHTYWWAQRLDRPEWTAFEDRVCKSWTDTHGVFHDVEAFLYRPTHPAQEPPAPQPPLRHFRGLDWAILHAEDTWLALRAGNNGGNHNNLDLGHFILGRGGERFLVDPGYGAQRTSQHNAVTVRGQEQADLATAPLLVCETNTSGTYLACELSECYPHVLETHVRHLIVHEGHLFLVDALRGRVGRRVSANYHFQTNLGMARTQNGVRFMGRAGTLHLVSLNGHADARMTPWKHGEDLFTSVVFYRQPDASEEISAFLLSGDPASAPPCTLDTRAGEITLHGGAGPIAYNLWCPAAPAPPEGQVPNRRL